MKKVILIAAGISIGIVIWSMNDIPESREINLVGAEILGEGVEKEISEIKTSSNSYSNSGVIDVMSSLDFGLLLEGQKFALIGNSPNGNQRLVLEVVSKKIAPDFTLIKASIANGQTSIITITETLTKILIKTPDNVFEYSGTEFNGVVDRLIELNLDDDIHHDKTKVTMVVDDEPSLQLSED